jgi:hypothetical protein
MLSVQEELVMKLISLVTGGDDAFGCDYVVVNLRQRIFSSAGAGDRLWSGLLA